MHFLFVQCDQLTQYIVEVLAPIIRFVSILVEVATIILEQQWVVKLRAEREGPVTCTLATIVPIP